MKPVSFSTFVTDAAYLNIPRFDRNFIKAIEESPSLKHVDASESGDANRAAVFALYQLYLISLGGSPASQLGLDKNAELHITFLCDNLTMRNMFFSELDFQMQESPYFKQYRAAYNVTITQDSLTVDDLKIVIKSKSETNLNVHDLRGQTRVAAIRSTDVKDEVFKALELSLMTVRSASSKASLPFTGTMLTFN